MLEVSKINREKKEFTVGEVAKATGLTVRTLQHYDNIGLLPVSGRTEAGRRYYTPGDLLKLEQIVFYKSLGISLTEIRDKLIASPSLGELEKILSLHSSTILKKLEWLHSVMFMMDASLDVIRNGQYPPWEMFIKLIRIMEGGSLEYWADFQFDPRLLDSLQTGITHTNDMLELYNAIKSIQIEAVALSETGRAPHEPECQNMARRWWELIVSLTNGDASLFEGLNAVNQNRASWPEADRKLFEIAEPFIESALAIYIAENNIDVPLALKGEY